VSENTDSLHCQLLHTYLRFLQHLLLLSTYSGVQISVHLCFVCSYSLFVVCACVHINVLGRKQFSSTVVKMVLPAVCGEHLSRAKLK